jgi:hypothetical protein
MTPKVFFVDILNIGIKKRIRWKSIKKVYTKKVRGLIIFLINGVGGEQYSKQILPHWRGCEGVGWSSAIMFPESVWLYHSPNFIVQMISTCLPLCRGRGDGGRHPVGYNNFDFFGKIKSMDPWMDAKLNSKTHLKQNLFRFFCAFLRTLGL